MAAETRNSALGFVVQAVRSFKGRAATGEDRGSTAEPWAGKTLEKKSKLWPFVKGLNQTVGAIVRALPGSFMQHWSASGRSLLRHCRRVKARSAQRCATYMTVSFSSCLSMLLVRVLGLHVTRYRSSVV